MSKARAIALVGLLTLLLAGGAAAQEEEQPDQQAEIETRSVKVQVKEYQQIAPADVYAAARDNIVADVRFRDTFEARTRVPRGARRITFEGQVYQTALAFRVGSGVVCLVPWSSLASVKQLLGIPADQPISARDLNRSITINPGQRVTVAGTILGTSGGTKYVLADSVSPGELPLRPSHREVHVFWPTEADPRIIAEPGTRSMTFPCTNVSGETASVDVEVQTMGQERLLAEVARLTAEQEGLGRGSKSYGEYPPTRVYRYASDGERINVQFSSEIQNILIRPLPASLSSAPAYRNGRLAQVPVVQALELRSRLMLLIPDTWPSVVQQAATAVPGEEVLVRGTVVNPRGPYNRVLVDMLWFPGRHRGEQEAWFANVQWPNAQRPLVFWSAGQYSLPQLPCQNVRGRTERMRLLISDFREIQVPVQRPPQPARPPAPEEQPAPAEEPAEEAEEGQPAEE